jgi:hypothetical protein
MNYKSREKVENIILVGIGCGSTPGDEQQQYECQDSLEGMVYDHIQPRVAAVTALSSLALSKGTGFWNSIRRLKTGARHPEQRTGP